MKPSRLWQHIGHASLFKTGEAAVFASSEGAALKNITLPLSSVVNLNCADILDPNGSSYNMLVTDRATSLEWVAMCLLCLLRKSRLGLSNVPAMYLKLRLVNSNYRFTSTQEVEKIQNPKWVVRLTANEGRRVGDGGMESYRTLRRCPSIFPPTPHPHPSAPLTPRPFSRPPSFYLPSTVCYF